VRLPRRLSRISIKERSLSPLGIPTPEENHLMIGFLMETFAVMVIQIVRISLLIDNKNKKTKDANGLAIGAAYTAMVLASAPISGGCFNPARSLGPLFFLDRVASNSQFIMAFSPFFGNFFGMFIYKTFLISEELEDELEVL
jgi:glycerol uptake facilitator-like aquaporin